KVVLLLIVSSILGCLLGSQNISLSDLLAKDPVSTQIFFEMRAPRILFVLSLGGALAVIGACYQTLFRNALAEPYVLGISSAVALGPVLGERLLPLPLNSIPTVLIAGFLAALLSTGFILLSFMQFGGRTDKMVLFGMGLNFVLSSALFLFLSYSNQQLGAGSM